jgi:hypothetical protein
MTPLTHPRPPTLQPTTTLAAACAAALALCLPAAHLSLVEDTGPLPVVERASAAPATLPCAVQRGGHGSVVQVANDSGHVLPRGARIAWATTGAPAAQGHWHWLAQPLAQGQGVSIELTTTLRGSGCVATLLR